MDYWFTVTATDVLGLTASATVSVTVSPTPTAVAVTPATSVLPLKGNQRYLVSVADQFGATINPNTYSVAWSASTGSIDSGGMFTAGMIPANVTVTATVGSASGAASVAVIDTAPVISNVSAVPTTVSGSSTTLQVTASDDAGETGLTYAWSATGPAAVQFSANGTNSAKNVSALFSRSGAYSITITATDAQGMIATQLINVSVTQTPTAIALNPMTATVPLNGTASFTPTVTDQFGVIVPANSTTVNWTATGGAVNSAGLYTAGSVPGTYSVTATDGIAVANATVTVVNTAPVIGTLTATPTTVTAKTTALAATASDDGGEPALVYTWNSTGPATVSFSASGTNAAKNATATFTQAGAYVLTLTARDTLGLTATRTVNISVQQTLTSIALSPASVTLPINGAQSFTATGKDQFNLTISSFTPTWTATGGSITSSGIYTAGATTGSFTVTAKSGVISASAAVTIAKGVLTGSVATPAASVNLTTDGPSDWAHWGLTTTSSFDHKAAATSQISNMTLVGTLSSTRTTASPTLSWTDGTPTASNAGTKTCLSVSGVGAGFQFSVPATTASQHLHLYIAVTKATGKLQATMSDGSVATFVDTSVTSNSGTTNKEYTLQFAGVSPGATLTVSWTMQSGTGSVLLEAATLAP